MPMNIRRTKGMVEYGRTGFEIGIDQNKTRSSENTPTHAGGSPECLTPHEVNFCQLH